MCSPWFYAFFCTELLVSDELVEKKLPAFGADPRA
jgi:hypothetical protein